MRCVLVLVTHSLLIRIVWFLTCGVRIVGGLMYGRDDGDDDADAAAACLRVSVCRHAVFMFA